MDEDEPYAIDWKLLQPFFYWAGVCLYRCQVFEYGLRYLIYLLVRNGMSRITPEQALNTIELRDKKTAGQLFGWMKDSGVKVDPESEEAIRTGLAARNDFIHGFLVNNDAMPDPEKRAALIKEMRGLRKKVEAADAKLRLFVGMMEKVMGFDSEASLKELREEARRLNETNDGGAGSLHLTTASWDLSPCYSSSIPCGRTPPAPATCLGRVIFSFGKRGTSGEWPS